MGLMDPEELSCSGVETDKGSVINSLEFPPERVEELNRDGNLTEFNTESVSADILALTLVRDILDESIEIFNTVDETNLQNNNASSAAVEVSPHSNQNLVHSKCDSSDKTDHLVEVSNHLESFSNVDVFTSTNPEISATNQSKDALENNTEFARGGEMIKFDDSFPTMDLSSVEFCLPSPNSTSSEDSDSTDSPMMSGSDSTPSQSNENIAVQFSNTECRTNSGSVIFNPDCVNNENYSEVQLVQNFDSEVQGNGSNSSSQHAETFVPSLLQYESVMIHSEDPISTQTNGYSALPPNNFSSLEKISETDGFNLYSNPATLPLSDSTSQHDCFTHPVILKLKKEHEETKSSLYVYKEKADRLDECLLDLEKMIDKVGLLEKKICQQEMELELSKQERDIESRALSSFRYETNTKLDSLKKQYEQANKEKEGMVMRYAKSEKELLDIKKDKSNTIKQLKDQQKENESVMSKLKMLTEDRSRLSVTLDNKNMELSSAYKEIDKLKEEINARDIKIKWAQNKVKSEMDLHKECPEKFDKLNSQIFELEKKLEKSKEDIEQYKLSIQELEAIKVLENQVKEEQAKLILERHDQSERVIKLKALQIKTDSLIEENNNLSLQVQNLEVERFNLDKRLSESRQEAQESANNQADLCSKLVLFDSISNQLTQERERLEKTNEEVDRLRKANEELMQDMSVCRVRESDMLSFTQKLTSKNVQLQSEFSNIESRAGELMLEAEEAGSAAVVLCKEVKTLKEELEIEKSKREEERNLLAREIAEGRAKITILETQLSDIKSNLHSSTNKHQALIRELQRELQVCHRRLEQEGKLLQGGGHLSATTNHHSGSNQSGSTGQLSPGASSSLTSSLNSIPDATVVQPHQLELSSSVLVERILKLQTESKGYQDKIEFLEDHNITLVEELKRKGRLLHSYILREQAGALSTQASDNHKLEVTKYGGIMASVYGSKATDDGMTLELSLQINHKLQAILEDTLLKNITLKENIDTLGDEIERLKKLHPS